MSRRSVVPTPSLNVSSVEFRHLIVIAAISCVAGCASGPQHEAKPADKVVQASSVSTDVVSPRQPTSGSYSHPKAVSPNEVTDLSGKDLSVPVLISALSQQMPIGVRGVCIEDSGPAGPARCPVKPKPVSLDQITFAFDSAELTGEARHVLDIVGAALSSTKLKTESFKIEGHTDVIGSDAYNLTLSKRRAEAVKRYLTTAANVNADRLELEAWGKSGLLYPEDPQNPKNRRVVFQRVAD